METRIAVVADVHLWNHRVHGGAAVGGLNRRCRQSLGALRAAVERAEALGAELFIIAGDLFDGVCPEPQLMAAAQNALRTEMGVVVLMGNHDLVSMDEGDHALGPLDPMVTVADVPRLAYTREAGVAVLCVPYQTGPASKWLPDATRALVQEHEKRYPMQQGTIPRVLVTHVGLADEATPAFLKHVPDACDVRFFGALLAEHKISVGLAGNWHTHQRFELGGQGIQAYQIGALVPTGWDNPGMDGYGSLMIVDLVEDPGVPTGKAVVMREDIPGPRFLGNLEAGIAASRVGHKAYVRVPAEDAQVLRARQLLDAAMDRGEIQAGEVVLDAIEARTSARAAAMVARSARTLSEALAEYVASMPLLEGVSREAVLTRARRYLRGGSGTEGES